jgi:hypothetical protein
LNLANGMTAGYGVNDGHLDNWPVNPTGHLYGGNPNLQPARIGFIRNVTSLTGGNLQSGNQSQNGLYTLYFMYNPNQISVNWATNPSQGSPLYLYGQDLSKSVQAATTPVDNVIVPNYASAQTVGWSLYFDRTYDMMYGANTASSGQGRPDWDRGVLKDVAALYNLMGTFVAGSSGAAVPFSVPCEVVFGQNGAGQLFGFTGYISSLQITYGIFRHDMIPSRAEVDISLTATYVTNQVAPSGGASTNATGSGGGLGGNSAATIAAAGGQAVQGLPGAAGAASAGTSVVQGPPAGPSTPFPLPFRP